MTQGESRQDGGDEQTGPVPSEEQTEALADLMVEWHRGETQLADVLDIDEQTRGFALAQTYRMYDNGDYETAEKLARGLVALDQSDFYPNMLLGDILYQQGTGISEFAVEELDADEETTYPLTRTEEAIRAFERAGELEPDDEFVTIRLAELYLREGREAEAVELFEQLAETSDDEEVRRWAETVLGVVEESV